MTEDKSKISLESTLEQYLLEHKLRRTPERFAILERIQQMDKHFTVEALCAAMEHDAYHVSRATVYYTVKLLVDAGIIRKHRFEGNTACYELTGDSSGSNHLHLVCLECGRVKEFRDPAMIRSLAARRYQSFSAQYFTFYVYGVCSQCQRRKRREAKKLKESQG